MINVNPFKDVLRADFRIWNSGEPIFCVKGWFRGKGLSLGPGCYHMLKNGEGGLRLHCGNPSQYQTCRTTDSHALNIASKFLSSSMGPETV